MSDLTEERAVTCPICWESITFILDLSEEGPQAYVEDCEVCCRPLAISFAVEDGEVEDFDVVGLED